MDADRQPDTIDTGLTCLLLLARYHGVPVNPEQLRHEFGASGRALDDIGLLRAARHLGFKVRRLRSRWDRLAATPLPAIAVQKDGSYVIVARSDGETVLIRETAGRRSARGGISRRPGPGRSS